MARMALHSNMRFTISLVLMFVAAAARADCPPPPDISAEEDQLLSEIRASGTEMAARPLTDRLWRLWTKAPDEPAQSLLDEGMEARNTYDYLRALGDFDKLVKYCPDYAEGYNQRAFVNFLREDYAAALPDLDKALARSPKHVAAMSGKALTLMHLGRDDEAQAVLRQALALHPWLPERYFLKKPAGSDL